LLLHSVLSRYEEIAEEAFGKLGRALVSSIIYVELFGTCCLLFILEVGGLPNPGQPGVSIHFATAGLGRWEDSPHESRKLVRMSALDKLLLWVGMTSLQGDNMFSLFGKALANSASQYMWIAAAIMIP
jgi:hypothetical protein